MGTIATVIVGTGKLVAFGFCLGIGFWASKKLTNVADEYLILWSKRRMEKLTKEAQEEIEFLNMADDVAGAAVSTSVPV